MVTLPGPIVSAVWLSEQLEQPGHLLGAIFLDSENEVSSPGDGARRYQGSWSHWSSNPSRPIAVGADR